MTNSHHILPHQAALSFTQPSLKWPYCFSLHAVFIKVLRCQQQKQTLATLDTKGVHERISFASRISGDAGEPSLELHSQSYTPKSRLLREPEVTWSNWAQGRTNGVGDSTRSLRARCDTLSKRWCGSGWRQLLLRWSEQTESRNSWNDRLAIPADHYDGEAGAERSKTTPWLLFR